MPRACGLTPIPRSFLVALFLASVVLSAQAAGKPALAKAATDTVVFKPLKSPTGAVLRSLVIPGWGQVYTRQYVKGAAAFIIEGTIIYSALYENDRVKASRKSAENWSRDTSGVAPAQVKFYRSNESFYRDSRNKLLWWLAGMMLLSMGDAYVDAQLYGLDFSSDISLDRRGAMITVACKF